MTEVERGAAAGLAAPGAGAASTPAAALPSRAALSWWKVARALVLTPGWFFWRPVMVGRENLPQAAPYILAPVHRSYVDTLLCCYLTRRRLRFMAKSGVFTKPWAAKLFSSLGGFPVRRGAPDREALQNCQRALAAGEPVVLFAEGRRSSGPVVAPLLAGPAYLALRANLPVVPVGIAGSEQSMPIGASRVRPVRIYLVVGRPIWPPPRSGVGRVPRTMVDQLTGRLQSELQAAFDQARSMASD
ncbi:MAG: lysophospholipid acyltransferase family protein [Acidimicrobiales bacterium]